MRKQTSKENNSELNFRDCFDMAVQWAHLQQQATEQRIRIQQIQNEETRRRKEQLRQNYLQHFNAAQQNYTAENLEAAIVDCLEAMRTYRESCDTPLTRDDNIVLITLYLILGKCCNALHRYDDAIRYCETGLALFENGVAPHKNDIMKLLINIVLATGKIDDARARLIAFRIPQGRIEYLYFRIVLDFIGNANHLIQEVDEWEGANNQLIQSFLQCINLAPQDPPFNQNLRAPLIIQLKQNLDDFENIMLMKSIKLMKNGEYIQAAKYINRVIKYIELTTAVAWINRRCELLLLSHTLSLCLAFEISTNNHHHAGLRAEINLGIREIRNLLQEYNRTKNLLMLPDQNFVLSMTHLALREWLNHSARENNLEALARPKVYVEDDVISLTEISNSWNGLPRAILNIQGILERTRIIFRHFLEIAFIRDYYDPLNLMLYSHCNLLDLPGIDSRVNLAKAHLAYCLIHAHRVTRDFVRAWGLATESSVAGCARGRAEVGYMTWRGLGRVVNIPQARETLEAAIALNSLENLIELNGSERARVYLDHLNYDNHNNIAFNANVVLDRLHDKAILGIVLAKVLCARKYLDPANNNHLNLNPRLPIELLEQVTGDVHYENLPDLFLGCVIFARLLREGTGMPKNIPRAKEILEFAVKKGSPEANLELATLFFGGFIHADGTPTQQRSAHLVTEVDILHAIPLVRSALSFNYIDKFVINDGYTWWSLVDCAFYDLSTRASTIPQAIRLLEICRQNLNQLHQAFRGTINYHLGRCYQFGQFQNIPNNLILARNYYLNALGINIVENFTLANNNANNPVVFPGFPAEVDRIPTVFYTLARLNYLRNDPRLIQQDPLNAQLLAPLQAQIFVNRIDTPVQQLSLHPRLSVRGNKVALIYKDQQDHAIYVRWSDLNRATMDVTYDMKNNTYRVFTGAFIDPNITVIRENVAICSAAYGNKTFYRYFEFNNNPFPIQLHEFEVTAKSSAMALTTNGTTLVEVHLHENQGASNQGRIYYFTGTVNNQSVNWHRNGGDNYIPVSGARLSNPSITMLTEGRLVLACDRGNATSVCLLSGRVNGVNIEIDGVRNVNLGDLGWNILSMAPQGMKVPTVTCDDNENIIVLCGTGNQVDDGLYYSVYHIDGAGANARLRTISERTLYDIGHTPTAVSVGQNIHSFHSCVRGSSTKQRLIRRDLEINSIVPGEDGQVHPTRYQYP